MRRSLKWLGAVTLAVAAAASHAEDRTLLNSSYDIARELFAAYNPLFAEHWKQEHNENVEIKQSHGGSSKQAQAILQGLRADVVTYNQVTDVQMLHDKGKLIPADWQKAFPNNSSPYYSTTAFLVRKGNPKGIHDWADLVKGDVEIVTPNPKTSGGARWNYLAAWAWADQNFSGDQTRIRDYVADLYRRAPVLDTGARGALTSFAQRQIGDVLLAWENEAYLALDEFKDEGFEIVTPSLSILAQPPVSVVDANVDAKGSRKVAEAYLAYLYSAEGQTLAARHHYRPSAPDLVPADVPRLPEVKLVSIDSPLFGGWKKAQPEHFGDGGIFDQIYKPGN